MNEIQCNTWQELLSAIEEHDCGNPEILCSDDPKNKRLGFCCANCNNWFWMLLEDLKHKVPQVMWPFFESQEGRVKLSKSFTRFRIVVWKEQEL